MTGVQTCALPIWIRFLHIFSAIAFVAIHGASIVVLYAIRKETDRQRIENLLGFSAGTAIAMYIYNQFK